MTCGRNLIQLSEIDSEIKTKIFWFIYILQMVKSKQWWVLSLTINNLGLVKSMGHTDKTLDIHPKPMPELGG